MKNFDPSRKEIIKDIKRISELANLLDPIGKNSFVDGYVTFASDCTKAHNGNEEETITKYREKIAWIKNLDFSVIITIDTFTISSYKPQDEFDLHEAHFFIGNILRIKKDG